MIGRGGQRSGIRVATEPMFIRSKRPTHSNYSDEMKSLGVAETRTGGQKMSAKDAERFQRELRPSNSH